MQVGFALLKRLRFSWECLEVFPHAIVAKLNAHHAHKSKAEALINQLKATSSFTGWPIVPSAGSLALCALSFLTCARHCLVPNLLSGSQITCSNPQRDSIRKSSPRITHAPRGISQSEVNSDINLRRRNIDDVYLHSPILTGRRVPNMILASPTHRRYGVLTNLAGSRAPSIGPPPVAWPVQGSTPIGPFTYTCRL